MRSICTLLYLFGVLSGAAQKALTFKEVLKTANEIVITDSFLIDYSSLVKTSLDKNTGMSFCKIVERKEIDSLNDADYSIAGKITFRKDFDILLLCSKQSINKNLYYEVKMSNDETTIQQLFFVLLDKEGNYKNSFLAAMDYRRKDFDKNITRKISSWIYTDLRIIQHTVTDHWSSYLIYLPFSKNSTKEYGFSMEYRINDYGVFVAYPKFKTN